MHSAWTLRLTNASWTSKPSSWIRRDSIHDYPEPLAFSVWSSRLSASRALRVPWFTSRVRALRLQEQRVGLPAVDPAIVDNERPTALRRRCALERGSLLNNEMGNRRRNHGAGAKSWYEAVAPLGLTACRTTLPLNVDSSATISPTLLYEPVIPRRLLWP